MPDRSVSRADLRFIGLHGPGQRTPNDSSTVSPARTGSCRSCDRDRDRCPRSRPRINLLDSALHAPQASFGGHDMYPEFLDQAAVLAVRISRKSPASRRKQAPRLGRRECRQSSRSTHTASHWANPASSKSPAATESIVLTASSLGTCRSCPLSAQNMVRQPWITLSSP
jgi:hypothetical protein